MTSKEQRIAEIWIRLDAIMDEIDGLSHVSEREQLEELMGEYHDLERELAELEQ